MNNWDALYEKALILAQEAHRGQTDKGGNPYITHPLYVASQVDTMELKVIALLHDALEDSDLTAEELRAEGFPESVVEAIVLLTHEDDGDAAYMEYIVQLSGNPLAAAVKRADLQHNMDLSRIPHPTPRDLQRREKYVKAWDLLNSMIES